MKSKDLAPVVVFTYNRLDTVVSLINSLKQNLLSKDTEIIIFSDYPKNENIFPDVIQVRKFLKTIDGFKSVKIVERNQNYGLAKNIIEGVTEIINKHGSIIVLEDDLVVSKNFLSFMNQALEFYKDDDNIFSISGFTWNLKTIQNLDDDVYLSYRPSSWGWGTWKNQWKNIDWNVSDFNDFMQNKGEKQKFNRGGADMTRMLNDYVKGKNNSWAIRWAYAMYKQNKYCIYPKISKIQNIGFGESATHCKGTHIHKTKLDTSNQGTFKFNHDLIVEKNIINEFKYQNSYINKFLKKINNFIRGLL